MDQCNVCGNNISPGAGVYISGLIKGADVFACTDCKTAGEKAELVRKINTIRSKYRQINWFQYTENGKRVEGHSFIFANGDVIAIRHQEGDCELAKLVEHVLSPDYDNDVVIDNSLRKEYYARQGIMYPEDVFSAENWW